MGELRGVCPHLHLPLQSGADRILDAMRRGYTADDYRQAVARLRERVPGLAVTTDVIVGFPTETREEFEATRRFMDEMEFDNAFIFKYSPRPATAAAEWKDDVPADEKLRRNHVLLDDQSRRSLAIHRRLLGRDVDVLVDGISPRKASRWCGRTVTNKIVVFDPVPPLKAGDLVVVRVTGARSQALYGELNRQGGDMGSPGVSPGRSDG
jgi:tRNA-2-methylthio-N6-dimethylallyladenosine synthase